MSDRSHLRRLLDRTQNTEFPLRALEAVRDLRRYLTAVEREAISNARTGGASVQDIADALGITRQAVYYKLSQPAATGAEEPDEGPERPDIVEIPDVEPSAPADDPRLPPKAAMDAPSITSTIGVPTTTGSALPSGRSTNDERA